MVLTNFLKLPILHHDGVLGECVKIYLAYFLALGTVGSVALNWEDVNARALRIILPMVGLVSVGYGAGKIRQLQVLEPHLQDRSIARRDVATMVIARQVQPYFEEPEQPMLMPAGGQLSIQQLDPVALKKQHTGLLICGDSGSAKTTLIRYCLPYWVSEGYQVIVLDPHADKENPESKYRTKVVEIGESQTHGKEKD